MGKCVLGERQGYGDVEDSQRGKRERKEHQTQGLTCDSMSLCTQKQLPCPQGPSCQWQKEAIRTVTISKWSG